MNLYKEALALRQKNDLTGSLKLFHHILTLPGIENVRPFQLKISVSMMILIIKIHFLGSAHC